MEEPSTISAGGWVGMTSEGHVVSLGDLDRRHFGIGIAVAGAARGEKVVVQLVDGALRPTGRTREFIAGSGTAVEWRRSRRRTRK